jgi:hypothetical protein
MGRFGVSEGLLLLLLQGLAIMQVLYPRGFRWARILLVTMVSYFAAFVAHIIGFMLLPDNAPLLLRRPVIALIWFAASSLACLPFLRGERALVLRCGIFCTMAYLLFAFAFDYIKPAPIA